MRISNVTTKSGQTIELGNLVVLVGPNNVGKSQFLSDIHEDMLQGSRVQKVIINEITYEKPPTYGELISGLRKRRDERDTSVWLFDGIASNLSSGETARFGEDIEKNYDTYEIKELVGTIGKLRVARLDAKSRLIIAETKPSTNPDAPPENLLQALFFNQNNLEKELQNVFKLSFGMEIKLDPSSLQTISFRVAKEFGSIPENITEQYLFFRDHKILDKQGDGFKSFVGVVLSILLSDKRIILLDEPEAFLHPTQAKILGSWLAKYAEKVDEQIFVATHNSNFLAGILSRSDSVNVFRLNRTEDTTTITEITSESISKLTKSPILSSQPVYDSIFYEGVIVCESDSDRILYQKIFTRELDVQNILFIHGHGKQTIKDIVGLLKEIHVPFATIVDLDILNSKDNFQKLISPFYENIPDEVMKIQNEIESAVGELSEDESLEKGTNEVKILFDQLQGKKHNLSGLRGALDRIETSLSKWDGIKEKGIAGIPSSVQEKAKKLIDELKNAGVFVVPVGELESWIDLGTRRKNKWILGALTKLENETCPSELKSFLQEVLDFFVKK